MNADQKERLLKLAENNPDLAKDVVDILKAEADKSDAPVAVKVVKDEADKIEITAEQKKWAFVSGVIGYVGVASFLLIVFLVISTQASIKAVFPFVIIWVALCIVVSMVCAFKAGMPTIKSFCAKHFKST